RHPLEIRSNALLYLAPDSWDRRAPVDGEVQLDRDTAFLVCDANAAVTRQMTLDEPAHALDLARSVRGVPREDVGGNRRVLAHVMPVVAPAPTPRAARSSGTARTWFRGQARCASTFDLAGRGRRCSAHADSRAGACHSGAARRSDRRACVRRARAGTRRGAACRGRTGSGRARSAG